METDRILYNSCKKQVPSQNCEPCVQNMGVFRRIAYLSKLRAKRGRVPTHWIHICCGAQLRNKCVGSALPEFNTRKAFFFLHVSRRQEQQHVWFVQDNRTNRQVCACVKVRAEGDCFPTLEGVPVTFYAERAKGRVVRPARAEFLRFELHDLKTHRNCLETPSAQLVRPLPAHQVFLVCGGQYVLQGVS